MCNVYSCIWKNRLKQIIGLENGIKNHKAKTRWMYLMSFWGYILWRSWHLLWPNIFTTYNNKISKTQKCLHVLDVFVDYKPSSCHSRVIDYCNACINRWHNWLMKTVIDKTTLVSYNNKFNTYWNGQSNRNLFNFGNNLWLGDKT